MIPEESALHDFLLKQCGLMALELVASECNIHLHMFLCLRSQEPMMDGVFFITEGGRIPSSGDRVRVLQELMDGLCKCGCGQKTNLAPQTRKRDGWVKGQPLQFVVGHQVRTRTSTERSEAAKKHGHVPTFAGRQHTEATKQKMREVPRPLAESVTYSGIHRWVRHNYPKIGTCSHCGESAPTDWANVGGEYKRDRDDWIELCRPCHVAYDRGKRQVA